MCIKTSIMIMQKLKEFAIEWLFVFISFVQAVLFNSRPQRHKMTRVTCGTYRRENATYTHPQHYRFIYIIKPTRCTNVVYVIQVF